MIKSIYTNTQKVITDRIQYELLTHIYDFRATSSAESIRV